MPGGDVPVTPFVFWAFTVLAICKHSTCYAALQKRKRVKVKDEKYKQQNGSNHVPRTQRDVTDSNQLG
jgi:hypothetical protein